MAHRHPEKHRKKCQISSNFLIKVRENLLPVVLLCKDFLYNIYNYITFFMTCFVFQSPTREKGVVATLA